MNVLAIFLAVLALSNLGTYFYAAHSTNKARDQEVQAERAKRYAEVASWVIESSERGQQLALALNKQTVEIREVTRTLTKEVPVYVEKMHFPEFIPVGLLRLHDAAARGEALPKTPGESVDAPSEIAPADAIGAVIENYGTCREAIAQVEGWQKWYADEAGKWKSSSS